MLHLEGPDEGAWAAAFEAALPAPHRVFRRHEQHDAAAIDYIFVWKPRAEAFDGLTRLKAVLSYGAGVDALLGHPHLPQCPIARFVDPDLTRRMTDFVVANVLMHTRLHTRFRTDQTQRRWAPLDPPPAWDVSVGIMGMGALGLDATAHLKVFGFKLRSWSRTAKSIAGVDGFVGDRQFDAFLSGTDILVNLLPLTPETRGILNYETLAKLSHEGQIDGPVLINAARGGHQREADLHRALTDGTLGAASLDVFETEPLPLDSPLWALPNCVITPHVAATSSPQVGAAYFARVIVDHERGLPLPNLVDVARGY